METKPTKKPYINLLPVLSNLVVALYRVKKSNLGYSAVMVSTDNTVKDIIDISIISEGDNSMLISFKGSTEKYTPTRISENFTSEYFEYSILVSDINGYKYKVKIKLKQTDLDFVDPLRKLLPLSTAKISTVDEVKPLVESLENKPSITSYNETWLDEPKHLKAVTGGVSGLGTTEPPKHIKYPHYFKDVSYLESIDVYRVLDLFNVTDPAVAHAVKKLLVTGKRGAKDLETDLKEAIDSLQRKLEMLEEDNII